MSSGRETVVRKERHFKNKKGRAVAATAAQIKEH